MATDRSGVTHTEKIRHLCTVLVGTRCASFTHMKLPPQVKSRPNASLSTSRAPANAYAYVGGAAAVSLIDDDSLEMLETTERLAPRSLRPVVRPRSRVRALPAPPVAAPDSASWVLDDELEIVGGLERERAAQVEQADDGIDVEVECPPELSTLLMPRAQRPKSNALRNVTLALSIVALSAGAVIGVKRGTFVKAQALAAAQLDQPTMALVNHKASASTEIRTFSASSAQPVQVVVLEVAKSMDSKSAAVKTTDKDVHSKGKAKHAEAVVKSAKSAEPKEAKVVAKAAEPKVAAVAPAPVAAKASVMASAPKTASVPSADELNHSQKLANAAKQAMGDSL
jgi:hypothetical protein